VETSSHTSTIRERDNKIGEEKLLGEVILSRGVLNDYVIGVSSIMKN
jgi:hypothetical protein